MVFLNQATAPYVPHWSSGTTTNLSIGTYYCNRGYQFWLKLCNMANMTSTVTSPGQPYNTPKRTLVGAGANNICTYYLSDYQSYFRIAASAGIGYAWNSWENLIWWWWFYNYYIQLLIMLIILMLVFIIEIFGMVMLFLLQVGKIGLI